MNIQKFTFNPFQVNTYIIYDDTKNCIIIDPGCFGADEQNELLGFLTLNSLKPIEIINTHFHIDHVLGNEFVKNQFAIRARSHQDGEMIRENMGYYAAMLGVDVSGIQKPDDFIDENTTIVWGSSSLEVIYTPGHAAGSICLYSEQDSFVITGDVLFDASIGRTDLPTGDFDTLRNSILQKLFTLPDKTVVYPGHGPSTTIGKEKISNPFI